MPLSLYQDSDSLSQVSDCSLDSADRKSLDRMGELVKFLEKTRLEWKQDRSLRNLAEDRALSHRYDRDKLGAACSQALTLMKDWCLPTITDMTSRFRHWFKDVETLRQECRLNIHHTHVSSSLTCTELLNNYWLT